MDLTTTTTTTALTPTKSPEPDSKAHQPKLKPISFTNGILKRHHPTTTTYKECLKNHAATLGGYALDGCGEFMPSPTATSSDPTSLKCAACGCHRNFHRRENSPPETTNALPPPQLPAVIEYHPHHRHHPLPPPSTGHVAAPPPHDSPGSHSPPPISSSYMLLALSDHQPQMMMMNSTTSSKKRFRTKFSQEQKERMHELAEKVGWKMHKSNEELVNGLCREIGVERGVFKVWMHNNKNTVGKRSSISEVNGESNLNNNNHTIGGTSHSTSEREESHHLLQQRQLFGSNESNAPTNGSSSSS